MNIEEIKIDELDLDPANVRRHDASNLDAIRGSLKRFGQQKPIVVNEKGVVIAGNGTLTAARALGWDRIKIVRTELMGSEATAFAIADNRTAELATWDASVLRDHLASLTAESYDIGELGFDPVDFSFVDVSAHSRKLHPVDLMKEYRPEDDALPDLEEEPLPESAAMLDDVSVPMVVELGRVDVSAADIVGLRPGQVIELSRAPGDAVDLVVDNRRIGKGELVEIEGELGVRILSLAK